MSTSSNWNTGSVLMRPVWWRNELKRTLVIGGSGFIGSHLVDRLLAEGGMVRVLDRVPVDLRVDWSHNRQLEYFTGDFVDHSMIDEAVKNVDVAYHLVSTTIPATSNMD